MTHFFGTIIHFIMNALNITLIAGCVTMDILLLFDCWINILAFGHG